MDYSLLVGIHQESQELVVGIVDFIGPYNWYKKLEGKGKSTIKETLGGDSESVTVISPDRYSARFRNAIDQYFLMVPGMSIVDCVYFNHADKWTKAADEHFALSTFL